MTSATWATSSPVLSITQQDLQDRPVYGWPGRELEEHELMGEWFNGTLRARLVEWEGMVYSFDEWPDLAGYGDIARRMAAAYRAVIDDRPETFYRAEIPGLALLSQKVREVEAQRGQRPEPAD